LFLEEARQQRKLVHGVEDEMIRHPEVGERDVVRDAVPMAGREQVDGPPGALALRRRRREVLATRDLDPIALHVAPGTEQVVDSTGEGRSRAVAPLRQHRVEDSDGGHDQARERRCAPHGPEQPLAERVQAIGGRRSAARHGRVEAANLLRERHDAGVEVLVHHDASVVSGRPVEGLQGAVAPGEPLQAAVAPGDAPEVAAPVEGVHRLHGAIQLADHLVHEVGVDTPLEVVETGQEARLGVVRLAQAFLALLRGGLAVGEQRSHSLESVALQLEPRPLALEIRLCDAERLELGRLARRSARRRRDVGAHRSGQPASAGIEQVDRGDPRVSSQLAIRAQRIRRPSEPACAIDLSSSVRACA
jgi:hypothetical protein